MQQPVYLKLIPSNDFNYVQFVVDQANNRPVDLKGSSIYKIDYPILYFRNDIIDYILEHGFTTLIKIGPINEELTTPNMTTNNITSILINYLNHIGIDNELIIIDPYFFAPNVGQNYSATVVQILSPFLSTLSDIRIVTASHSRAFSNTTKLIIEGELHNASASLRIHHTQSNHLHDRFWISNKRKKGILTGTSLNGFGNKYAIIDYLEDDDVAKIINEVSRDNLI